LPPVCPKWRQELSGGLVHNAAITKQLRTGETGNLPELCNLIVT